MGENCRKNHQNIFFSQILGQTGDDKFLFFNYLFSLASHSGFEWDIYCGPSRRTTGEAKETHSIISSVSL